MVYNLLIFLLSAGLDIPAKDAALWKEPESATKTSNDKSAEFIFINLKALTVLKA